MTVMKSSLLILSNLATLVVACMFTPVQQRAFAQVASSPGGGLFPVPVAGPGRMNIQDIGVGEVLHLIVGHSMVLHGLSPLRRIYVGDPAVLRSFTSSESEVVLTAKNSGISSLVLWDTSGQSRLYTVAADVDPESLRQSLGEAYPAYNIGVEGHEGRIYLTGAVPTQDIADGVTKLAGFYAKDVVSSLRVLPIHGKQVQLKLRIVEVDRTRMEQYGINFFAGGKTPLGVTTGQFPSTVNTTLGTGTSGASNSSVTVSNPLNIFLYSTGLNLGVTVQDLEQKQILQVLAEPTLTAMSGQSAKFLSGGEFPYPVVQGGTGASSTAITIMFRSYGVKVDFMPTVNADGSIRLKVSPEVSTLDFSNSVTISGFTIPALSTRRAETEVEIQSGQSFAVSGLLDHRTTESLSKIPGIASLPILGKLFVSKSYTHSIVELVVLVTATVVDPLVDAQHPDLPKLVVPNMDADSFDLKISKEQKIEPRKP